MVEPILSVRYLLPQLACDRRESRDYYGAPHGAGHRGVDERRIASPEESDARTPSLLDETPCFSRDYGRRIRGSAIVGCGKALCLRTRDALAPWYALAREHKVERIIGR